MADSNGLFELTRRLLDNNEVPNEMTREALWGVMAVVYKDVKEVKTCIEDSVQDRKQLNTKVKWLVGVVGFFGLVLLPDIAKSADALWKLLLALL